MKGSAGRLSDLLIREHSGRHGPLLGLTSPKRLSVTPARCYNPPVTYENLTLDWEPMPLTLAEVDHIAELAKLNLTDDERALFRDQLSAILDYAARLQQVDTSGLAPMLRGPSAAGTLLGNVLREDQVQPSLPVEDVLANAPQAEDGYFRVRAILDAG